MNQEVETALHNLDVPASRIHVESYGGAVRVDNTHQGRAASAIVELNGQRHDVSIKEYQTVLEAVLEGGLAPAYSCQSGVCGACRAHCEKGSVHMRASMALEEAEIERGIILTCQAVATSDNLTLTYD
ncbi:MAG: 2Fe-2S iron-sulfur cluster-binding protein [Pseudomonadota bacterium]